MLENLAGTVCIWNAKMKNHFKNFVMGDLVTINYTEVLHRQEKITPDLHCRWSRDIIICKTAISSVPAMVISRDSDRHRPLIKQPSLTAEGTVSFSSEPVLDSSYELLLVYSSWQQYSVHTTMYGSVERTDFSTKCELCQIQNTVLIAGLLVQYQELFIKCRNCCLGSRHNIQVIWKCFLVSKALGQTMQYSIFSTIFMMKIR